VIALRPFTEEDDAALISWLPTPEAMLLWTGPMLSWPLDTAQIEKLRADPTFTIFTAIDESGEALGHIELIATGDGEARMGRVLVDPSKQGRGIGEQMVRAVIAAAESRGIHTLALFVLPGNARAIALYEKLGWRHAGESTQMSGALLMELAL